MGFLNFVLVILFAVVISIAVQISSFAADIVFILLALHVFVMQRMALSTHAFWAEKVKKEGALFYELFNKSEVRHFCRGRLFWTSSIFQLVYYVNDGHSEYWFVCGSWIIGGLSKNITIYKTDIYNKKLRLVRYKILK